MKVVTTAMPIIDLVPRFYPYSEDIITLEFENGFIIPFTWVIGGNLLTLTLTETSQFKQRENYSFTLFRGNEIVYKGKMIFLKNGTDVQNYTNNSQDNKRWQ
jgi:hypothetical protein